MKQILSLILILCINALYSSPKPFIYMDTSNTLIINVLKVPDSSINYSHDQSKSNYPKNEKTYEYKEPDLKSSSMLFIGFVLLFSILIYIKIASPEYLKLQFQYFINGKAFLTDLDKSKQGFLLNNILLDFLFVAIISVYLFEYLWIKFHYLYIEVFIVVFLFYFGSSIINSISFYIFYGDEQKNIHLRNVLLSNRMMAVVLLPIVFVSLYSSRILHDFLSLAIIILLSVFFLYRLMRIFNQLKYLFSFNYIYNFLYLCVFEISLYIVFFKQIGWFV